MFKLFDGGGGATSGLLSYAAVVLLCIAGSFAGAVLALILNLQ